MGIEHSDKEGKRVASIIIFGIGRREGGLQLYLILYSQKGMIGQSKEKDDCCKKEKSNDQSITLRQSNGKKVIHYTLLSPFKNTINKQIIIAK